eukprot:gene22996-biopygen4278
MTGPQGPDNLVGGGVLAWPAPSPSHACASTPREQRPPRLRHPSPNHKPVTHNGYCAKRTPLAGRKHRSVGQVLERCPLLAPGDALTCAPCTHAAPCSNRKRTGEQQKGRGNDRENKRRTPGKRQEKNPGKAEGGDRKKRTERQEKRPENGTENDRENDRKRKGKRAEQGNEKARGKRAENTRKRPEQTAGKPGFPATWCITNPPTTSPGRSLLPPGQGTRYQSRELVTPTRPGNSLFPPVQGARYSHQARELVIPTSPGSSLLPAGAIGTVFRALASGLLLRDSSLRGTLNVELRPALPDPREAPGSPGGAASSALAGGRSGRAGCGTHVTRPEDPTFPQTCRATPSKPHARQPASRGGAAPPGTPRTPGARAGPARCLGSGRPCACGEISTWNCGRRCQTPEKPREPPGARPRQHWPAGAQAVLGAA